MDDDYRTTNEMHPDGDSNVEPHDHADFDSNDSNDSDDKDAAAHADVSDVFDVFDAFVESTLYY